MHGYVKIRGLTECISCFVKHVHSIESDIFMNNFHAQLLCQRMYIYENIHGAIYELCVSCDFYFQKQNNKKYSGGSCVPKC